VWRDGRAREVVEEGKRMLNGNLGSGWTVGWGACVHEWEWEGTQRDGTMPSRQACDTHTGPKGHHGPDVGRKQCRLFSVVPCRTRFFREGFPPRGSSAGRRPNTRERVSRCHISLPENAAPRLCHCQDVLQEAQHRQGRRSRQARGEPAVLQNLSRPDDPPRPA
jgi:hypothetical protein